MAENISSSDFSDRDKSMMSLEKSRDKDDDDNEAPRKKRSREAAPLGREKSRDDEKAEKNRHDENEERAPARREAHEAEEIKDDKPTEEELHMAVEQYVEVSQEDLKEDIEAAPENSVEEVVALSDAALLETIVENGAADEKGFDEALAQTIEDLGLGEEPAEQDTETVDSPELEEETVSKETPEEEEDDPTLSTTTPATPTAAGAATPVTPTPPVPPVVPPGPPGGGAGLPPSRGPAGVPFGAGGAGLTPIGPSSPSVLATTGTAAASPESWYPRRRRGRDLLVGGLVGYMIGRRGGRLRTEARLLPVKEKLEKEVTSLHDQIAEREAKIRRLAAEKAAGQPEAARQQIVEKLESRQERKQQERAETAARPEAPLIHRPEAFGRLVLPKAETSPAVPVEVIGKSTETMTLAELLVIAEKIERDGISVREMYDARRLDAIGLRRVIHEFLQGKRFDRILDENLKTPESMEYLAGSSAQRDGAADAGGAAAYQAAQPAGRGDASSPPQPVTNQPAKVYNKSNQSLLKQNKTVAVASGLTFVAVLALLIILFG